jgi:hypothetical protein
VIVTDTVPVAAVPLAVSVNVLLPVVGFGLKEAVTPLGKTEVTDKPTLPLKPFTGFTVMVLVPPVPPCTIVTAVGEAKSEKSGAGAEPGHAFNKLATLMVPMPVAKSHPVVVPYAGCSTELEMESTP